MWGSSLEIAQELSSGRGLARAGPGKDTGVLRAVPSGRGVSPGWLARGWAVGGGRGSLLDPSCGQPPCRDRHAQATPQARGGWSFFSQGPQVWSLPRHGGLRPVLRDKCRWTHGCCRARVAGERPRHQAGRPAGSATAWKSGSRFLPPPTAVSPGSLCSQGPLSRGPRGLIWTLPWKPPQLCSHRGPLCSLRT